MRFAVRAEDCVSPRLEKLLALFTAAYHVDGAEPEMPAETNDHPSESTPGRGLQQPGPVRHVENAARHQKRTGGIDKESRRLLVCDAVRHRHDLVSRHHNVLLPIASLAVEDRDPTSQPPTSE